MAERGEAKAGSPALLLGFGAGMCYAAQVVTVPLGPQCRRRPAASRPAEREQPRLGAKADDINVKDKEQGP